MGAAPAAGFAPRSREASGHRPGGTTAPVRGARWKSRWHHAFVPCLTERQPDEGNWRLGLAAMDGLRPDKRGPESSNRRQAERHGACGWWLNPSAPHPGSTDAADYPTRLAALRCPSSSTDAGRRAGISAVRFRGRARTPPPCGEGIGVGVAKRRAALGGRVDRRGQSWPRSPSGTTPTPSPPHKGEGYRVAVPALPRPERLGSSPSMTREMRGTPPPCGEGQGWGSESSARRWEVGCTVDASPATAHPAAPPPPLPLPTRGRGLRRGYSAFGAASLRRSC
jgi:hypothetical protein